MADITLTFDDDTQHTYQGVPDSVTQDEAFSRAQKDFPGLGVKHMARVAKTATPAPIPDSLDGSVLNPYEASEAPKVAPVNFLPGARQRLEKKAGVGVFADQYTDEQLNQRVAKAEAAPRVMTAPTGPVKTFSENIPLNIDSPITDIVARVGQTVAEGGRVAGDKAREAALNLAGLGRDMGNIGLNTPDDLYETGRKQRLTDIATGRTVRQAELTPSQKEQANAIGEGAFQLGTALLPLGKAATLPGEIAQMSARMGVPVFGNTWQQGKDEGLSGFANLVNAVGQTMAEVVPEAVPMAMFSRAAVPSLLEGVVKSARNPAGRVIEGSVKSAGADALGEVVSQAAGDLVSAATGDQSIAPGKMLDNQMQMLRTLPTQMAVQLAGLNMANTAKKSGAAAIDHAFPERAIARELQSEIDNTSFRPINTEDVARAMSPDRNGQNVHKARVGDFSIPDVSLPTPGADRQASSSDSRVGGIPDQRNPEESDKEFAKRVIDLRDRPAELPEDHYAYFNVEGATRVPISELNSTKLDEENLRGAENGPKRMIAAAAGEIQKRDPLTVMPSASGKGYDVIDGNGTLAAVKEYGWKSLPVNIVDRETGQQMLAERSGGGMPLQTMNVEGMPAGDVKLQKALRAGGHRVAETGKMFGAPPSIVSHGDLVRFRNRLSQLADEGKGGRMWYEDSGRAVLDLAEGNKDVAEKIVGLLAIYSPQQTVSGNTTLALKAYADYMRTGKVTTISNMGKAVAEKSQQWMDGTLGQDQVTGIKRSNFYRNLMREIDPDRMGADAQGVTVDMHIARAGGYYSTKISSGLDEDSSGQYQFMDKEIKRVAKGLGWEPQQVQAAIWVAIKARVDAVMPDVREKALAAGWLKKEIRENRYGKQSVSYKAVNKEGETQYEKALLEAAMKGELPDIDSYSFGDALKERIAQISWEARPGESTGILPGIHTAPLEQQAEYLQAMDQLLRDENGQDEIAVRVGLAGSNTFFGPSAWQGVVAHGAQTETALATDRPTQSTLDAHLPARDLINTYAAIRGYILSQEAVVWHYPNFASTIKAANGMDVDFGRALTIPEVEQIYQALSQVAGHTEWAPAMTRTGFRVLNFTDTPNKDFHTAVQKALDILPETFNGFKVKRFGSIGDYIGNDWTEAPNGEGYRSRIGEAGRPDLLQWADDKRRAAAEINAEFAAKYGWDKGNSGSEGSRQGLPAEPLNQGGMPLAVVQQAKDQLVAVLNRAKTAKPEYDSRLRRIASQLGGIPIIADVKSFESAWRKVENDYKMDASRLKDGVRGSILLNADRDFDSALESIKRDFDVLEIKDRRGGGKDGYRDILINVRMPSGIVAEIQLHSPEIWVVKEGVGHDFYKQFDDLRKAGNEAGAEAVLDMSRQVYGLAWDAFLNRSSSALTLRNSSSVIGTPDPKTRLDEIGMSPSTLAITKPDSRRTTGKPSTSNLSPVLSALPSFMHPVLSSMEVAFQNHLSSILSSAESLVKARGSAAAPLNVVQNQSGAGYAYQGVTISQAGYDAPPVADYRPKLTEAAMASRMLQPLEGNQSKVINAAIKDLLDGGGIEASWAKGVTFYGLKPMYNGYANYNPTDHAVGVQWRNLDEADREIRKNDGDTMQRNVRGWLAHELHHFVDNYKTSSDTMYYFSMESPRMDTWWNADEERWEGGAGADLMNEATEAWYSDNEITPLRTYLSYPMIAANNMAMNNVDGSAFLKVEMFAQMGAIYATSPDMMKVELPTWYAFFEEWQNARGNDATVERSRITLRAILQKPVSAAGHSRSKRGAGISASPVRSAGQGVVGSAGRPGMGENDAGAGKSGGAYVLPPHAKGTANQSKLSEFWAKRGPAPADNHLPTHVNYTTFSDANGVHDALATLSRAYEKEIQTQRRGTVSIKQSYAEAVKLMSSEAGLSSEAIEKLMHREPGTAAGAAEILARMTILETEAAKLEAMSQKIAAKDGDMSDKEALAFAEQLDRTAMAHQTFLGARAEIGRAMNAIRQHSGVRLDSDEIHSILRTYGKREGLAKVAEEIANGVGSPEGGLLNGGAGSGNGGAGKGGSGNGNGGGSGGILSRSPASRGRANRIGVIASAASDPTVFDALVEMWKAGLLTGLGTHIYNIAGTMLFTLMRIPTNTIAGIVGAGARLGGAKDASYLAEVLPMTFGMVAGVSHGLRAAWETLKDEDFVIGPQPTEVHQHAMSGKTFGLKGPAGKAVDFIGKAGRSPFRALSAADALFKMVNMYGTLYSAAMRAALNEGGRYWHSGFSHRVGELLREGERAMLDPDGKMGPMQLTPKGKAIGAEARADAMRYTFQEKVGKMGQWVNMGRNNIKALHFIIPFNNTPMNIFRLSVEHTPFAPLAGQWRADIKAGGVRRDRAVAQLVLGSSLGAVAFMLQAAGMMTGGGDPDKEKRIRRRESGVPDYAIKIPGTTRWVEYRRFEPVGTLLGAAADAAEAYEYSNKEDADHLVMMVSMAFSQAVLSKTYMKGMNDFLNVVTDPERYGSSWEQSLAGSFVPAGVAAYAQSQDPYVRDSRAMGEMGKLERFIQTAANGIKGRLPKTSLNPEFNRQSLPIARDSWGEERTPAEGVLPGGIIRTSTETGDKVRAEAARLGVKRVEPSRKVMGVPLTTGQYQKVGEDGGKLAHMIMETIVELPAWDNMPRNVQKKVFEEAISAGRQFGAGLMTPQVINRAVDKIMKGVVDAESD